MACSFFQFWKYFNVIYIDHFIANNLEQTNWPFFRLLITTYVKSKTYFLALFNADENGKALSYSLALQYFLSRI